MEFIGTFFLTVAISLIGNPIAIGLMLMAMIYVGGHISGAHFNPAISFAMFIQNRLRANDLGMYVLAQSLGALVALCFFTMITGNSFTLDIVPGSPLLPPFAIEALLILVLCWVYLTMNVTNKFREHAIAGIVIGLTLMAIVSAGSLFNPAVAMASLACSLFREGSTVEMGSIFVYVVAPLLGGFVSSYLFDYFKPQM